MVRDGIARRRAFNDDRNLAMERCASEIRTRGAVAYELYDAAALAARAHATLEALCRGLGSFAETDEPLHRLESDELEQLACMSEEVAELSGQLALAFDRIPLDPLHASHHELAEAACDALADGIADHRRALMAARLQTATLGFPALAEALIDSDAHCYWPIPVVEVLAAFRDVDPVRARQVAALAGVSAEARFCELAPERVLELAHTLHHFAAR
jgi:hypothetical protein